MPAVPGNRNPFLTAAMNPSITDPGIGPMLEIPSHFAPQMETAESGALQAPRIDPVMTVANVLGGEPFGVISPTSIFKRVLGDILAQHTIGTALQTRPQEGQFPAPPAGYQEGYYPRSKYAPPRSIVPFRETEILHSNRWRGAGKTQELRQDPEYDKPPWNPKSYKEDLPDYVKASEEWGGPEFLNKLAPVDEPPDPRGLLWHAIGLEPNTFFSSTAKQIQDEGMKQGWFSEQPNPHFGYIRIGAKPEDLPPLTAQQRLLKVDPNPEIIPDWGAGPGRGTALPTKTVSGHWVDRSVHPSKFVVIDSEGNLLGRLAKSRAGEKATQDLGESFGSMVKSVFEDIPK